MNIGTLSVSIVAVTDKFAAGISKSQTLVKKFTSSLGGLKGVLAGLGAGYSFSKAAGDIDKLAKASDRLNVSTENLMGLGHAADLSGVAIDGLTKSLTFMQKTVGDGDSNDVLMRLGLNVKELRSMQADQMFLKIAGAINNLGDASEKTNVAMALFGKSGAELLPLISEGESAIRGMMREADALGMTMNRLDASKVEEMNDAVTRLKGAWDGLARSLVLTVAPAMDRVAKGATATLDLLRSGVTSAHSLAAGQAVGSMSDEQFGKFRMLPKGKQLQQITGISKEELASTRTSISKMSQVMDMVNAIEVAVANRIARDAKDVIQKLKDRGNTSAAPEALPNPKTALAMFQGKLQGQMLLASASRMFGFGKTMTSPAGIGDMAGMGLGAAAKAWMNAKPMGQRPSFALTQSGSAESFRQRAAISRQNDAMKLAKEDKKEQQKHTTLLGQIVAKLAPLAPANL